MSATKTKRKRNENDIDQSQAGAKTESRQLSHSFACDWSISFSFRFRFVFVSFSSQTPTLCHKNLRSGFGPADRIHHRLDSVVLRRPRRIYRHRKLSQRVPDRPVVLVHRQSSGAYRRKRHAGRVSGPSGVVGQHVTMPTGFRSFRLADRVVHSVFRSAGPDPDRRSQG